MPDCLRVRCLHASIRYRPADARATRPVLRFRRVRAIGRWALRALLIIAGMTGAGLPAKLPAQTLPDAPSSFLLATAPAATAVLSADPTAAEPVALPDLLPPELQQPGVRAAGSAVAAASAQAAATPSNVSSAARLPPCPRQGLTGTILFLPGRVNAPCQEQNPLQTIVDSGPVRPLTVRQKGQLALRDFTDPFNFITIAAFSGITIAANSHTAYGPGVKGFARLSGYSLAGAAQGGFLGTFAIPVLTHEDPRYHRMPGRPFARRLGHAIIHTYVTQHDNGSLMPNYSVLLGYPIGAEISNFYVPGLQTNAPSTTERIAVGIATDPVGAIIAEFLPDVARHIHLRVIFMQQILNQVANGSGTP
jgi:hypothetical protein